MEKWMIDLTEDIWHSGITHGGIVKEDLSEMIESAYKAHLKSQVEIPASLFEFPGFRDAWRDWLRFRKEKARGANLPNSTAKAQLAKLEQWGGKKAIDAIRFSIERGYTGLFEPEEEPKPTYPVPLRPLASPTNIEPFEA